MSDESGFYGVNLTILVAIAALLGFWIVGAYNRLVRLRSAIHSAFGALDAQIRQRHELLVRWLAEARELFDDSPQQIDAVATVADNLQRACDETRKRPSSTPAVTAQREAEQALAAARGRLLAELPAHMNRPSLNTDSAELMSLGDQILAVESTLSFARQQFNASVDEYNKALTEFPTTLICGLFGFQPASNL
ncbi:LemA family protein [Piscinibacter sakaiensis]|uniref:LemA family protein n=1 Tax=Piscinibacter sakaiensis TaxID=1547922 RepID=UPI003AACF4BA